MNYAHKNIAVHEIKPCAGNIFCLKKVFPVSALRGYSKRHNVYPPELFSEDSGLIRKTIVDIGANNGDDYTLTGYRNGHTVLSFEPTLNVQGLFSEVMRNHNVQFSIAQNQACNKHSFDQRRNLHSASNIQFCIVSYSAPNTRNETRGFSYDPHVYLFPVALSDNERVVHFAQYTCNGGKGCGKVNRIILPGKSKEWSNRKIVSMHSLRLDDLQLPVDRDSIWYVKVDAEGHELSILEGSRNLISRGRVQYISIEFSPNSNLGVEWGVKLLEELHHQGFSCFHLRGFGACHEENIKPATMECNYPFQVHQQGLEAAPSFLEYTKVFQRDGQRAQKLNMADLLCKRTFLLG